ncbi:NAD(P)H-dependent oxidoreductase [Turicibacter bilis]|uniref:NAD(P)H-dependent oxidoreductase n=1 Tax=Turicibacter bilis TaxID=2735723 RepID=A0ABY5JIW0_9FIRM|nr:NAD(P)H-dependent oxidoreductase [Turicibacter bilis]MBS3200058.1 NAD(P)H-dependent oxidoreductase [Turicibacter bilis]UUF05410.1 NAD(P)H-dependent oxidoreductase [Turicibacter bilis]
MTHEQILEILNFRHACKEFDSSKKISDSDFEIILKGGQLSPSSMGIEPWKFLVIQNESLREELATVSWGGKKQIPSCSHLVILLSRMPKELKHDSSYIHHLLTDVKQMPQEAIENFKGVIKMIEDTRFQNNEQALLNYSCLQTYIAAANMMTVSAMQQIDSCAMGGYDQEAVEEILIKHNLLNKDEFYLTLMIAFGYRINEPTPKTRQSLNDLVVWVK